MKKEITRHNYPGSEKIYVPGKLHDIRVAMRKVNLTDTVNIVDGERVVHHNDPVYIYDTSGVYTDPSVKIDLEKGLPRLRESWVTDRGDVEKLQGITSEYGRMRQADKSLVSNICTCPIVPNKGKKSRRCTMPNKASSPPKWSM